MASWVLVPTLAVPAEQWTKALIDYIETNYSLTDPDKSVTTDILFKEGFFTTNKPYEITTLEQETVPQTIINNRDIIFITNMDINLRMYRLNPNGVDPQLWDMRQEIIRILGEYQKFSIPGVIELVYMGGVPQYITNSDADAYAEQDWRYVVKCAMQYEMRDIST